LSILGLQRADHGGMHEDSIPPSLPWPDLPDVVARRLTRFSPNHIHPEVWESIGPFVRSTVAAAEPHTPDLAIKLATHTAQITAWAYEVGLELRPEVVFHPDTIDRWIAEGLLDKSTGTRTNYRTMARKIGRALLGPRYYPAAPLAARLSDPVTPYTVREIAALRSCTRGLRTEFQRAGATGLLTLAAGAGLTATEINEVAAEHVELSGLGPIIAVPGDRARRVPVRAEYEQSLLDLLDAARGRRLFLADQTTTDVKRISRFQERQPRMDAPKISVKRLRVTWMVQLLDEAVPIHVIATAAGVEATHLARYADFLTQPDDAAAVELLRGTHR
jgi:hypothetical protein